MKGYRKYSLAAGSLVLGFVLAIVGKLTGDFATISTIAVAAFAGGNAVEHMAKRGDP